MAPTSGSDPSPGGNHHTFKEVKENLPESTWLWNPWIPIGLPSMLAAEAGIGKSLVAMSLCRSVTTGADFLDGQPIDPKNQGMVLWLESESMHRVDVDRAESMGIPLDKIVVLSFGIHGGDVSLDNPDHLEEIRNQAQKEEIKLIVLDSFSAAFGGHENSTAARNHIQEIGRIAQAYDKAFLVIHHLTKGEGKHGHIVESLARVRGRSALVQYVRTVNTLDTPNKHLPVIRIHQIKNNLASFADPLGFTIKDGLPELTELPGLEHVTRVEEGIQELKNLLQEGPKPSTEVLEAMGEAGFPERTTRRVSKNLGVIIRKETGRDGKWIWSLPPGLVETRGQEAVRERPPEKEDLQPKEASTEGDQVALPETRHSNMYANAKTWNPHQGCELDCSYCKASFQRQAKRHAHWCAECGRYEPHFHDDRLGKIPSSKIVFVSGMGDVSFCDPENFRRILGAIHRKNSRKGKKKSEQTFYFQSKRPAYFEPFLKELPENAVLLTTLETNRDKGYHLISKAPVPSERYRQFLELDYPRKVVTIEPVMDFDHDVFLDWIRQINPEYVYLGFNSKPKAVQLPEPSEEKLQTFMQVLESHGIEVYLKELRGLRKAG